MKYICNGNPSRRLCDGCGAKRPHEHDPEECKPHPERKCPGCHPVVDEYDLGEHLDDVYSIIQPKNIVKAWNG